MSDLASEIVDAIACKIFRVVLTTQTDRDWLEAVIRSGLESHTKRVGLLEAVAGAARVHARLIADGKGLGGMALADFVAVFSPTSSWRMLLETLAALEACDD